MLRRLVEDGDEEAEDDEEVEEEKDMQKTCERTLEEGEKARTVGAEQEKDDDQTAVYWKRTCYAYATRFWPE